MFWWLFKINSINDKIPSIFILLLVFVLGLQAILKTGEDPGDESADLPHNTSLSAKPMNWAPSRPHFVLHADSCCGVERSLLSTVL